MRKAIAVPILILFTLGPWFTGEHSPRAASIKGSESVPAGYEAASYPVVRPNEDPGFKVIPLTLPHASSGRIAAADLQTQKQQEQRTVVVESRLPDRIGPMELQRLILDLPGTFELIDLRPAAQFRDYSIPGSRNLEIAAALQDPSLLTGPGPLILVDRDGSLAMAVGGILSQKSQRVIKVLHGGLQAYWEETEKNRLTGQAPTSGMPGRVVPVSPAPLPPQVPQSAPAAPPAPAPPKPAKPQSAGC